MKVRLTFLEPVLGTWPSNENVARDFIASKAPDASTIEDEIAALVDISSESSAKSDSLLLSIVRPGVFSAEIVVVEGPSCVSVAVLVGEDTEALAGEACVLLGAFWGIRRTATTMIMAIGIATISAFPSGFCFFARRAPQAGHFFSLALICAPQERQITFRFQVPQFGHSFILSSSASPQRGHLTEYTSFGMVRTPGFVRYNNFTTRVLQSQG